MAGKPDLGRQTWFRSAHGDFNLWSNGIRASDSDKSSLKYRLRNEKWKSVRDDIYDLLRGLCGILVNCQQVDSASLSDADTTNTEVNSNDQDQYEGRQSPDSWEVMSRESSGMSSETESINSNSVLSEHILNINTILDQLIRITLAIRKSGNRTRYEDIDNDCDEGDYQDFAQLLTATILRAHGNPAVQEDTQHMSAHDTMKHFSDVDRLSPIQRRLVRTNILRRNRFNAFKSKPNRPKAPEVEVQSEQLPGYNPGMEMGHLGHIPRKPESVVTCSSQHVPERSMASVIARTATEPGSTLNIDHILDKEVRSAATKMTRIGSSQTYPPCPQFKEGEARECPYCNEQLPLKVTDTIDESLWK
ncbi:unnamed protein product [Alternaria alternata]